jgi:hypothetical protein
LIPIQLKTSVIKFVFIAKSKGESVENDGDKFASNIHGFKFESTSTSNPYTSKQLFLNPAIFLIAA